MKKIFTLLALIVTLTIFAQAPQGFNYQATVRNATGALVTNQNVYFKFNIMLNSQTSVPIYTETHYVPTDDLGQVNLVIGTGTASVGTFATISWATGSYFLGIELKVSPSTTYVPMGTTQLLSVPYAMYANSSGNPQAPTPNLASVLAVNNSANNTKISNLADPTDAQDAVTKAYVDNKIPNGSNIGEVLTWNGTSWNAITSSQMLPTVSTLSISTISNTTAVSGGEVTSQGGSIVTDRGICFGTTPNPFVSGDHTTDASGTGTFSSNMASLSPSTTYYVRAYATNSYGTSYGIQQTFTTLYTPSVSIGQAYQGGKVAYIFQPGDFGYVIGQTHGLIASTSDLYSSITWGNSLLMTGATDFALGLGKSNTTTIISYLGVGNYAASICHDYLGGGYDDWFLPSPEELVKVFISKDIIGGFSGGFYWTSRQYYNPDAAGCISFSNGNIGWFLSGTTNYLRAVRYF
ncbi:hypothetical protein MCEGE10_01918 [Flavobacteriaceae bacterium]